MEPQLLRDNIERHVLLSDSDWFAIASTLQERRFKKGDFLSREGDVNRFTNFIETGSARVYHLDEAGNEHIVQLGVRGWWLSDFASFTYQVKGLLYVEALENTTVMSISFENLQKLFELSHTFERFYRLLIQSAYASFQNRILHNLSLEAENRYVHFAQHYPQLDLQISQKHIASYLGMSPEFLSKIKKRLHQKKKLGSTL